MLITIKKQKKTTIKPKNKKQQLKQYFSVNILKKKLIKVSFQTFLYKLSLFLN